MNRISLLLGMGLTGILTIALIVSADQSYAGVDGMRAVTAFPPVAEQDPLARPAVPVISGLIGLLEGIRDLPLIGLADRTAADPAGADPAAAGAPTGQAATPAGPATAPSGPRQPAGGPQPPTAPAAPAAPTATPKPAASPVPTSSPAPTATPAPTASVPVSDPPAARATPVPTATPAPTATAVPLLAVTTDRGATAVVTLGDVVPGDTIDRTITVKNTGTLGFRYAVSATQTATTLLWTDPTNGLQLTVSASGGTVLYRGPVSGLGSLASATVLAPGDTELLRYTFALPAGAPNTFQGLLQDLTLVFTATQYP